jgi:hypothetical protein
VLDQRFIYKKLIQVNQVPTLAALFNSPEARMSAMWTDVAFIFFSHPLFGAGFTPSRDGAKDYLFPHRDREIIYEFTGKIRALVTAFYFLVAAA